MPNVKKLIDVIDGLEKQSNELESAINMYNEIKILSEDICNTSDKNIKLIKKIEEIELNFLDVTKKTDTYLNEISYIKENLNDKDIKIINIKNEIIEITQENWNKNEVILDKVVEYNKIIKTEIGDMSIMLSNINNGIVELNESNNQIKKKIKILFLFIIIIFTLNVLKFFL